MKRPDRSFIRAEEYGILVVVGVLVVLVILLFQQLGRQSASTSCPAPLQVRTFDSPQLPVAAPTPWLPDYTPPAPLKATPITYRITQTLDMCPDLPTDEKGEVIICKPGGVYVKILTPPSVQFAELPMDRADVIVAVYSSRASMGQHPPKPATVLPVVSP